MARHSRKKSPPNLPKRMNPSGSGGETHQQVAGKAQPTAYLTTNHGTRISDNQNSLRLGNARADAARRLRPSREDLPLRPRAHSRAHRACSRLGCARLLRVHARDSGADARDRIREEGQAHAGVLPLLDGRGLEGLQGHAARCSRLRGQVLLRRRATGTSSATTFPSSSSRMRSSFRISSMP